MVCKKCPFNLCLVCFQVGVADALPRQHLFSVENDEDMGVEE